MVVVLSITCIKNADSVIKLRTGDFHNKMFQLLEELTSMSQKLLRVLLPVGVVDSGVLVPVTGMPPTVWIRVIGEGLDLKTREPLRCLGLSFTSFTSGTGFNSPKDTIYNSNLYLSEFNNL